MHFARFFVTLWPIMAFEQVIGQREVQQRLTQMVSEGRLPHAIMLCGPQGCGKKALAIGFAQMLLARTANDEVMLRKLEHPDLHFTYPTIKLPSMGSDHKPVSDDFAKEWHELVMGGPYFTMTEWLEQMGGENQQAIITAGESDELVRKLSLKSSQGGYKISLVWLPERMNTECANKILKLLEEPPSQTVFIMVSEEPDRLLETIRSRVQRIDVKRIADYDVHKALVEKRGLTEDMAQRITRMANGNWLKALQMLSTDSENEPVPGHVPITHATCLPAQGKRPKDMVGTYGSHGTRTSEAILEYFLRLVRENFMYNFQQPDLCYMTQREEDFARNFARFINEANVLPITDLANVAIRDIGQNANAKIVFFDFALQMIVLLIQK